MMRIRLFIGKQFIGIGGGFVSFGTWIIGGAL